MLLIWELSTCSAVDQFKKQFAHLEENSGKNSPVVPLERKHASLPRYACYIHDCSFLLLSLYIFSVKYKMLVFEDVLYICGLIMIHSSWNGPAVRLVCALINDILRCRSTIVHSNTVYVKDQTTTNAKDRQNGEESCSRISREFDGLHTNLSRSLQPTQRIIPQGIYTKSKPLILK